MLDTERDMKEVRLKEVAEEKVVEGGKEIAK